MNTYFIRIGVCLINVNLISNVYKAEDGLRIALTSSPDCDVLIEDPQEIEIAWEYFSSLVSHTLIQ